FLILQDIPTSSFLSTLPDSSLLSQLCLPGTHESLARYGWPISTCQSMQSTVQQQLQDGIRYLDIRLVPKGEPGQVRLLAYHGITDERIEMGAVLSQCWQFLQSQSGKRETIIMSIKQESGDQDTFIRTLFDTYVDQTPPAPNGKSSGRDRWFLENRVPTLGEVRGKIVMLSRFVIDQSYGFPGGISPPIWPNSLKGIFNYTLPSGQEVFTQDWYDIGSLSQLDAKFALIEQLSKQSSAAGNAFSLNYTNGSSFPFALPPAVAKGYLIDGITCAATTQGINIRVRNFVADLQFDSKPSTRSTLPGLQITWAMDYYNEPEGAADLVPLLISSNF
ncbi:PLC-like phosphodiesterase, partial [Meira miltonrushii]